MEPWLVIMGFPICPTCGAAVSPGWATDPHDNVFRESKNIHIQWHERNRT